MHEMRAGTTANVDGDKDQVGVPVATNPDALHRDKQIALVGQLNDLIAAAANVAELEQRTEGAIGRACRVPGSCGETATQTKIWFEVPGPRSRGYVSDRIMGARSSPGRARPGSDLVPQHTNLDRQSSTMPVNGRRQRLLHIA